MIHSSFRRLLAVAALALALSSCTNDKKVDYCPGMASVLDAVIATQFKPGAAPEPANALYTVQITKVKGNCKFDKLGKTSDSNLTVTFEAVRPAPGEAEQFTIPYFVAVTQANRVITKQMRSASFHFEAGDVSASFEDEISSVSLVTDGDKKPYEYQVLVGLQLSKAQLDYNRSIGIFAQ